ncbi:1842_t:CDS:2 [Funneliformis caledonium]|uniref:Phosphatidylserine decarboxylase proenzyme 1, mitochondrial n=1 Tax=Funneliformis caledonium TaxID=1117310 RepID=A0A9N9CRT2_9GLOM|nr:1842_t:CDS:2 [Funneliformis caledonium]
MILSGIKRASLVSCRLHSRTVNSRYSNAFSFVVTKRTRAINVSASRFQQKSQEKERPFAERLNETWKKTKVTWYPIPIGLGIAFIAFQHLLRVYTREKKRKEQDSSIEIESRPVVIGPWQVYLIDSLPLRAFSRLWGRINNEYELPVFLREPCYKFYSWLFKCNLEEIENTDLKSYPNLGSFFYRSLKADVRPIEDAALVSPADGKVLSFGLVKEGKVEQVKGATYSLDALIGRKEEKRVMSSENHHAEIASSTHIADEKEFANLNGITYSLDTLLGDDTDNALKQESSVGEDASIQSEENDIKKELIVAKNVISYTFGHPSGHKLREGNTLHYCVIYLAPGDYHRFHSPTSWVVETRRHFAGELFSVSPYMVNMLPDLFVLNERVALLGRWRCGFFSMIPIGATNVGSIRINFDKALRTNRREDLPVGTYTEVSYKKASKLLGGQPLRAGDEMGGFCLGSTIALVFEAPSDFKFCVETGQKIKYGQKVGEV